MARAPRARASRTAPTVSIASSRAEIARFLNRRSAMIFPTGYQANLGMLAGLAGPRDVILMDADSHSSIYDGCRLSGATVIRFRHNDPDDLDRRLGRLQEQGDCKLIVVEGIYSMLGDRAPLAEFAEIKRRHGAFLLVDEAHSLGVLGSPRPRRRGGAGDRGRRRLRGRHLQQEPRLGRRLRRVRSSEVRRAPLLQPTLHVHRVVLSLERRLGAGGVSVRWRDDRSCASGSGTMPGRSMTV